MVENNNNRKPRKWYWWIYQVGKIAAAVVVVIFTYYNTREERATKAEEHARKVEVKTKVSHETNRAAIVTLQKAVEKLVNKWDTDRTSIVSNCNESIDGMRENVKFFLLGQRSRGRPVSGRRTNEQQESERLHKKVDNLQKLISSVRKSGRRKPTKFRPPAPFHKLKLKQMPANKGTF
jgi:uncharacterized protein YlxW (UPF0749 family)